MIDFWFLELSLFLIVNNLIIDLDLRFLFVKVLEIELKKEKKKKKINVENRIIFRNILK